MRMLGVTQRVDSARGYAETRDGLDQKWWPFLYALNLLPVTIGNYESGLASMLRHFTFNGFLFTGGNSLCKYDGRAPERDAVETRLLEYAIENNLPVLGICRGMQVIQDYFGVRLCRVPGHVNTSIEIRVNKGRRLSDELVNLKSVNAFHEWGAYSTSRDLEILATSTANVVMAVEHQSLPIFGLMWHPERESQQSGIDQSLFNKIFFADS